MKRLLIVIISLAISACSSGLVQPTPLVPARERSANAQPSPIPTPSRIPTPSVDFQQTAIVAQSTADAANKLMVEVTAAEDQRRHEELAWTHTADQATIAASGLTAQSDIATSTAALTSIPLTQTQAPIAATSTEAVLNDRRTMVAMTLQAPTLIKAFSEAQIESQYAETNERVDIGVRAAIAFFVVCLGIFLIVIMIPGLNRSLVSWHTSEETDEEPEDAGDLIPFVTVDYGQGVDYKVRAEIDCPKKILFELADGIVNRNLTMSYNTWEGTDVHRYLKTLREYFTEHHFVKHVRGQNGMLDILSAGEQFLRHVVEHGEPPAPHRCIG